MRDRGRCESLQPRAWNRGCEAWSREENELGWERGFRVLPSVFEERDFCGSGSGCSASSRRAVCRGQSGCPARSVRFLCGGEVRRQPNEQGRQRGCTYEKCQVVPEKEISKSRFRMCSAYVLKTTSCERWCWECYFTIKECPPLEMVI